MKEGIQISVGVEVAKEGFLGNWHSNRVQKDHD